MNPTLGFLRASWRGVNRVARAARDTAQRQLLALTADAVPTTGANNDAWEVVQDEDARTDSDSAPEEKARFADPCLPDNGGLFDHEPVAGGYVLPDQDFDSDFRSDVQSSDPDSVSQQSDEGSETISDDERYFDARGEVGSCSGGDGEGFVDPPSALDNTKRVFNAPSVLDEKPPDDRPSASRGGSLPHLHPAAPDHRENAPDTIAARRTLTTYLDESDDPGLRAPVDTSTAKTAVHNKVTDNNNNNDDGKTRAAISNRQGPEMPGGWHGNREEHTEPGRDEGRDRRLGREESQLDETRTWPRPGTALKVDYDVVSPMIKEKLARLRLTRKYRGGDSSKS
ncbi:hypothetical protein N658DRAFT_509816 [Parathielavia hyrcaniae]|uniref:Uncharacterized protein n=1 Tax=Parathielavia hyrcaniae TaxID=113614 RepID=A0AAN6SY63_9PEZI|nr:hypothetical protein N658DRAFT_509816 [Parathielavia hyrcaniae]